MDSNGLEGYRDFRKQWHGSVQFGPHYLEAEDPTFQLMFWKKTNDLPSPKLMIRKAILTRNADSVLCSMHACMYVCMHVCMYVRMYACMHACMYGCMYTHSHIDLILYYMILYYFVLYYITLYHITLYHIILYTSIIYLYIPLYTI